MENVQMDHIDFIFAFCFVVCQKSENNLVVFDSLLSPIDCLFSGEKRQYW